MSEVNTVSPLLDAFSLGSPFSSHNGITCSPAIHTVTNEKFILKKISIPESQVQVEAMLLTGACADREAAQAYYEDVAKSLEREIALMNSLAQSRGFASFFASQTTKKPDGEVGLDLWVLSPHRTTLAAYMEKNTMTHLSAVNLGIDLCAALAVCRKAGYLYQDLKPENIYLTQHNQFQLGDFGLLSLDDLTYATFPDKYRSVYAAPELFDDFAEINPTIDIYALGMVLYRIYNGGQPPFFESGEAAESMRRDGRELPTPRYADYEMAEILLKATAFHPESRWKTPEDMGQALIAYMQRNSVNDSIIAPPPLEAPATESPSEMPEGTPPGQADLPAEDVPEESVLKDQPPEASTGESAPAADAGGQDAPPALPETVQEEAQEPVADQELEDILTRAESFLHRQEEEIQSGKAHAEEEPDEEAPADGILQSMEQSAAEPAGAEESYGDIEAPIIPKRKFSFRKPLAFLAGLLIMAMLAAGGWYFYTAYYCVPLEDLTVAESSLGTLTVSLSTEADPAALTVTCQDTYGNSQTARVENGKATFSNLQSSTQYTITVTIDGFHKLTGTTQVSCATSATTEISNFNALVGGEDGSAVVRFDSMGTEPTQWTITCTAQGQETKSVSFQGHTVTLTGLTVGTEYNLQLTASDGIFLDGTDSISFTASAVCIAQNVRVTQITADSFTIAWDQPEVPVSSWSVQCSNGSTYNETLSVTDCTATFTGIDTTVGNTVRITAAGMSKSAQFTMTADPVMVQSFTADDQVPGEMGVSWTFTGTAPDQWRLTWTGDDGSSGETLTDTPMATVGNIMPGVIYTFGIESTDGTTVLCPETYTASNSVAAAFAGFGLTADDITIATFPAPEGNWGSGDLNSVIQSRSFTSSDRIGFLLRAGSSYDTSDETVNIRILVRNDTGIVSHQTKELPWSSVWSDRLFVGELETTPSAPGTYALEIYFNNQLVQTTEFTITES